MKDKRIIFTLIALIFLCIVSFIIPKRYYNESAFLAPNSLISSIEAKTFDLRQKFTSKFRKVSEDILLIALDDSSFEYMTEEIGHWPMPRSVYVDMINYVQTGNPKAFTIDILFTGAWNEYPQHDFALAKTFDKYDNLYAALYFDDAPFSKRTPKNLPEKHSAKLINYSKNFKPYHSDNVRQAYSDLLKYGNLGAVNIIDYEDGMSRSLLMFVSYPTFDENLNKIGLNYYPNMSLKVATKLVNYDGKQFIIDKNNNLLFADKKIPMTENSEVVLNWYHKDIVNVDNIYHSFFNTISFKDLYISIENVKEGKEPVIKQEYFKDKIVFFGFTAETLFDIKSTPVEKYLPGVELHATFINNFLDNSFIKKCDTKANVVLSLFILFLSFIYFYLIKSTLKLISTYISLSLIYILISYVVMFYFNLWIPIILPCCALLLSLIITSLFKYIIKSSDFDKLYLLVNTDELTGLYNKRFFNEQMDMNIKYSLIYNKKFSLIIIDIDYFKKFNDTYGHLSGDCVLKQVAQILKNEVQNKGAVCRYGGEEMCIILPQIENEEAHKLAQHICSVVAQTEFILVDNVKTNVTISLGVSIFPDNATTTEKLIEYADKGLYWAKNHGRNQVGKSEE